VSGFFVEDRLDVDSEGFQLTVHGADVVGRDVIVLAAG